MDGLTFLLLLMLAMLGTVFIAPLVLGRYLGKSRPGLTTLLGMSLAALPATLPCVFTLLSLVFTGSIGNLSDCYPPECGMGMIWIKMFLWLAIPCFLIGLFLGWLGLVWGRKVAGRQEMDLPDY